MLKILKMLSKGSSSAVPSAAGAAAGAASRTTETKDPEGDLPGLSIAVAGDDAVVCDLSNINKL